MNMTVTSKGTVETYNRASAAPPVPQGSPRETEIDTVMASVAHGGKIGEFEKKALQERAQTLRAEGNDYDANCLDRIANNGHVDNKPGQTSYDSSLLLRESTRSPSELSGWERDKLYGAARSGGKVDKDTADTLLKAEDMLRAKGDFAGADRLEEIRQHGVGKDNGDADLLNFLAAGQYQPGTSQNFTGHD